MGGVVAAVVEGEGACDGVVLLGPVEGGGGVQTAGEEYGYVHGGAALWKKGRKRWCMGKKRRNLEGAVFGLVLGDGGELDAAAGAKAAFYFHPGGGDGGDEIVEDAVDDLFVEGGVVAVGSEVVFEAFGFDALVCRAVGDGEVAGVRLAGHGAEGGELVRVEYDGVGPLRGAVREGFEFGVVGGGEEGGVLAEEGEVFGVVHGGVR